MFLPSLKFTFYKYVFLYFTNICSKQKKFLAIWTNNSFKSLQKSTKTCYNKVFYKWKILIGMEIFVRVPTVFYKTEAETNSRKLPRWKWSFSPLIFKKFISIIILSINRNLHNNDVLLSDVFINCNALFQCKYWN